MEPVLEGGDDAEVAAAAAERPEQVRVLVGAGAQELTVCGHHLEGQDVVAGQPVFPCKPAYASAQRQPCYTRLRDDSRRYCQTEDVRLAIQLAQQHARLDARAACDGIDVNALHAGQVDDHAAVAQRAATHVVTAAAYRYQQPVFPGEPHRGDDVRQPRAAGNQGGTFVDTPVPDLPCGVVLRIALTDD